MTRRIFWLGGLAPLGAATIILLLSLPGDLGEGEPFSLFGGVSIWPTQIMRVLGMALGLYLGTCAWFALRENRTALSLKYFDCIPADCEERIQSEVSLIHEHEWRQDPAMKPTNGHGASQPGEDNEGPSKDSEGLWFNYCRLGQWKHREPLLGKHLTWRRDQRLLLVAFGFVFLSLVLIYGVGTFDVPHRGAWSFYIDKITSTLMAGPIFFLLLFWVIHEIDLCIGWIQRLTLDDIYWPDSAIKLAPVLGPGLRYASDWLSLRIIAERTEAVGRLLPIPFIVEFVMLLGQGPFFDNWDFSAGVATISGISTIYALSAAIRMRRAAESARAEIMERFQERLIAEKDVDRRKRASILAERMEHLDLGAFRSWKQQPLVRALLWILSGIGVLAIEYSATMG